MSITEKVKAAEKRVLKALDALTKPDAKDTNRLCDELRKATDEYRNAIRELKSKWGAFL